MAIPQLYDCYAHWAEQGTVWIYSDPHFNDPDQRKMCAGWLGDEEQVAAINKCVGKKDTIIILGDCGDLEYVKKIRGYKVLIAGNHDTGLTAHKEVFDEVYSGPLLIGEKILLSHEPIDFPFAFNFHGHCHGGKHRPDDHHMCLAADVINFTPVHFNSLMKTGILSNIETIHRDTINKATKRKAKRKK